MDGSTFSIEPVRVWDLFRLTQMAYANMTGIDMEFTRFARHRLARLLGYAILPLYLLTSGKGYKAVAGGEIAGCAYVHLRELSGVVFNVNVNRPYRRQGIGRALMLHLESKVRAAGLRWIALQVDKGNVAAQRLYEELSYRAYHPYFLRGNAHVTLLPPRREQVTLNALTLHEGRRLFKHYADLEQKRGDPWAANVVKHDFGQQPPPGGIFWRCVEGQEEIGCAWQKSGPTKTTAIILLKPAFWEQPMVTLGLLRLLDTQADANGGAFDVHFGSSGHHSLAAPPLVELGFEVRRQPRILMLKELTSDSVDKDSQQ